TPTLDGVDVTVHRVEVGTHRHDRYVAPPSLAPRRNIARPLVVPATVLLDRLEAERIGIPSKLAQLGHDPRLDLDRLGLRPARKPGKEKFMQRIHSIPYTRNSGAHI